jgi:hypothetical protein
MCSVKKSSSELEQEWKPLSLDEVANLPVADLVLNNKIEYVIETISSIETPWPLYLIRRYDISTQTVGVFSLPTSSVHP